MAKLAKNHPANLPKKISEDLNRNTMFNMFGLVNLSALKARNATKIEDKLLKRLINARFGHEMATGRVEFMKTR